MDFNEIVEDATIYLPVSVPGALFTYKLESGEIAEVLGSAAEYRVSEVADRNAGVVLKINKARLQTLTAVDAK
jgi:hypothetical protein